MERRIIMSDRNGPPRGALVVLVKCVRAVSENDRENYVRGNERSLQTHTNIY